MTDTTYNGWKNYPTWAVDLWLSNDEGLYSETQRIADDVMMTADTDRAYYLAGDLKAWVTEDLVPDLGASFAADLLGYALDQVDWNEIAAAWLEGAE